MFDHEHSRPSDSAGETARPRLGGVALRAAAILALDTLSVAFVMVCTCDLPFQHPSSIALLLLSLVACLGAAAALFLMRTFLPEGRPIVRALASVGIAVAIRYVELMLAINAIARLAERSR